MVKSIVSAEPGRTDRGIGNEAVDAQDEGVRSAAVVWRSVWRSLCGVACPRRPWLAISLVLNHHSPKAISLLLIFYDYLQALWFFVRALH